MHLGPLAVSFLRWLMLANYQRPVAQRKALAWIIRNRHVQRGMRDCGRSDAGTPDIINGV
jgi:hypothetical protein